MAADYDSTELRRVYQHVFLPPNLPQSAEESTSLDRMLLASTRSALEKFPGPATTAVDNAINAIKNLQSISETSEAILCQALETLSDGHTLPVHVRSQNAGMLITRKRDNLIFEAFELSPTNSDVLAAKGRLTRCFPAVAVAVDTKIHPQQELIQVIAKTLHALSNEVTPEMQPESKKAGTQHKEYRDTTDPALVTEMFFGFLRGLGKTVSVSSIAKQTRDEVFWGDALAPWRRSPMWLLIKVTLHLIITRAPDGSERVYKRFLAFFMSHLLDAATKLGMSSEVLYAMNAKISRRIHKLNSSNTPSDDGLNSEINVVLKKASAVIASRWQSAQNIDARNLDLAGLARLDFEHDTHIALPALEEHIASLRSRGSRSVSSEFQPTSSLLEHTPSTLPGLPDWNSPLYHYTTANLHLVETWIAENIDDWIRGRDRSCDTLYNYMRKYYQLAGSHYRVHPEGMSIMILTIFELWVACDKLAIADCPLLAEYPPDVPLEPLQNLLLPYLHQMVRLHELEKYLDKRAKQAHAHLSPFLFSTQSPQAFATRYFQDSREHQDLRDQILKEAKASKLTKQAEYRSTRNEYDRLDGLYSRAVCEYRTIVVDDFCDPPETRQDHRFDCQKCSYSKQRDALRIKVHEWPLPADDFRSAAVVFEMKVPAWYAAWRDAKTFLLHDVLNGSRTATQVQASYILDSNDPHLTAKCANAKTTSTLR